MRFFRSSDAPKNSSSSSRAKSRFSFRRHSEDDADKPSSPLPTRKQHSHSQPSVKPALAATFVSSASTSTSASSSITSPTAIQRSSANNDSEEPEDTISTPRDSTYLPSTPTGHPPPPFSSSSSSSTMKNTADRSASSSSMARTNSSSSNSSSGGGGGLGSRSSSQRHSLVGYHQLEFSMSYKNRKTVTDDPLNPHGHGLRSSFVTSSSSSSAGRRSANHTTRDSTLSLIDELPSPVASSSVPSAPSSSSSSLPAAPLSEARVNEASVAALQTRRAFQQMVLALEDDESSDYDYDSDSDDRYSFGVRPSSGGGGGGIVRVGADDYRKFQFRLNHLEELCAEQARKQSHMEQTIEREVQQRTAKVVEAMEKKIAMYKQAKDLEVEREIQRRVSSERGSSMSTPPRESSFFFHQSGGGGGAPLPPLPVSISSSSSSPPGDGVDLKGKPLDKIFHPRRTRRRMELLREREEQQKREMEQFREFIRSTEMRSTLAMRPPTMYSSSSADTSARESIAALRDPHITEDLLVASPNELIEMICVLRKHVSVQESQLDEAKKLISAAIEAREEAEETAREAVELTMELDSRLERASQEMIELQRRSSEFYMDRNSQFAASFLRASSSSASAAPVQRQSTHLPRTASFPR